MDIPIQDFPNIYSSIDKMYFDQKYLEAKYLKGIFYNLYNNLGKKVFSDINFNLIFDNQKLKITGNLNKLNIYVIIDEHQRLRFDLYDGKNIIFQAYYSEQKFKSAYNKLFPFPLGYNGKLDLDNSVSFADRNINVFFSGNLHKGRSNMYNYYGLFKYMPFSLQHRLQSCLGVTYDRKYPDSYIRFTNGFLKGLDYEGYANYIRNSKIILTPSGSCSEECFRHYEALKCGCVVISDKLPENPFLTNSPIIQVDNWKQADQIIKELLNTPDELYALHQASLRWWEDMVSEQAVARYMKEIILQHFDYTHE